MRHEFPYPNIPGLDIPDTHRVEVYGVKAADGPAPDEPSLLSAALRAPIGMARLAHTLSPTSRVLLLVDDVSRPTPADRMLPILLEELAAAGVPDDHIRLLLALGTHRRMTDPEIQRKVGPALAARFQIVNHEADNPEALRSYGTLADGTPVILNAALHEADCILGVGSITPHPVCGFSGGGKIVAPGVAAEPAIADFHWASVQVPQREVLGVRDNPMRQRVDEIAQRAGLTAIFNVVLDGRQRIVRAVAGHPVEAHRAGCATALELCAARVPRPHEARIFIADTHPLDQDLWQGTKAMCALECIVPDGAVVILVSPLPEGVAHRHPEVLRFGYHTLEDTRRLVATGQVAKLPGHNIAQGGRLTRRTVPMLVSPGVTPDEAVRLGWRHFATPQAAFTEAARLHGPQARVVILSMGGEICPIAV